MKKQKIFLLFSSLLFLTIICALYFYGSLIANRNVVTKDISQESNINLRIVYFSDVNLYEYLNDNDFKNIITTIQKQNPDVVLFGGNFLSPKFKGELSQEKIDELIKNLKSISAPYGMFAVYGDHESEFNYYQSTTAYIFQKAHFEFLNDKATKIYKNNDYINLIGVFNKGQVTTDNNFILSFSHNPDNVEKQTCNMMLAGKTLGGQVNLPFFNSTFFKNIKYHKQSQTINNCQLFVSNGVGTTKIDFRLFAPANIIVLDLKKSNPVK